MKYIQAEKEVSIIKFNIPSKIHILIENEDKSKLSCRCRGWCGINHLKFGWGKSEAKELENKFSYVTSVDTKM